jgi:hypothetical protein
LHKIGEYNETPIVPPVDNTQHIIDSVKQAERAILISKLDSSNLKHKREVFTLENTIIKQRTEIKTQKQINEELIDAYENDPDLVRCDSVVESQKKIIAEQDSLIESLDAEAMHYADMLANTERKVVLVEVDKKEITKQLVLKDNTIKELQAILVKNDRKHKFWNSVLKGVAIAEGALLIVKSI